MPPTSNAAIKLVRVLGRKEPRSGSQPHVDRSRDPARGDQDAVRSREVNSAGSPLDAAPVAGAASPGYRTRGPFFPNLLMTQANSQMRTERRRQLVARQMSRHGPPAR